MTDSVFTYLLVPLVTEADSRTTCYELNSYPNTGTITIVDVIEKTSGYLDKTSLEARQEQADQVFAIVEDHFEDDAEIRRELHYWTDVIEEIVTPIDEFDVSAICFTPRVGGRIHEFLTRDLAYQLITGNHHPAAALPEQEQGGP